MESLAETDILDVRGLRTAFAWEDGTVHAVDGVDFRLKSGETLAIVGESGSGKSVTCLSLMRLVDRPGRIVAGTALFRRKDGTVVDLLAASERTMRGIRGDEAAMIFQEPMTSLNPLYTIGDQIAEVMREHRGMGAAESRREAVAMLRQVRIGDPERRAEEYPHQMSGGMRQRVMIAMALSCRPAILFADEPTTALDVTIQAQILDLMRDIKATALTGMSIVFVTHNMGVVAEMADAILVMYAGLVVESGPVREVFRRPLHPYTMGLLGSIAHAGASRRGARQPLTAIPGNVPDPLDRPPGCPFAPRCDYAEEACRTAVPAIERVTLTRETRCLRWGVL